MRVVKIILKGLFPILFLKRAFLLYNSIKANTVDRLLFPQKEINPSDFLVHDKKNPFLELALDLSRLDTTIRRKLEIWSNPSWVQDQYLLVYNEAGYIEPASGWGVSLNKQLIYPSLGFSSAPYVHKPSILQFYIRKPKVVALNQIISLRDTGEENYFHFFNDILPKLFFLEEKGFDLKQYQIVISERLFFKSYFQFYYQNTFLGTLNWVVQKTNEWIRFEKAIFCKPYTHSLRFFEAAVNFLPKKTHRTLEKRVFLTRGKNSLRFLGNEDEIFQLARLNGFEIVDASELGFEDQIRLFQETRVLIAIHGAGLTNMMFRMDQKLTILEIVPDMDYIPFHYIMLAHQLHFHYEVLLGSKLSKNGSFTIDADHLKHFLDEQIP